MESAKKQDWQDESPLGACGSVQDYQKVCRVGEGTYGYVYKAVHKVSGDVVALKRIILHNERQDGFPLTSIREIKTLKRCAHENVISLMDVVVGAKRDAVFLLFEYCEHDLHGLLKARPSAFREPEVKCLALQLLQAVQFIHAKWVVHRDIKMSNLLYNNKGVLKLADFGLARTLSQPPPLDLTPKVVTLWYRAPELLLGAEQYSFPVDIWSAGCVVAELLAGGPVMRGESELPLLSSVFSLLGAPSERIWPGLSLLPLISRGMVEIEKEQQRCRYNNLPSVFPSLSPEGLDFLQLMLTYSPALRSTARDCLQHVYLRQRPYPVVRDLMPSFSSSLQTNTAVE